MSLLGDHYVVSEGWREEPFKRMDGNCPQEDHRTSPNEVVLLDPATAGPWAAAAQTAVRFAQSFGLTYGTLDIMMDGAGRHYVVDANKTPYWGADFDTDIAIHLRSWLRGRE